MTEDALMRMAPPGVTRLDEILPTYDFNEVHSTMIRGTPALIFDAVKTVASQEILFFQFLMGVRRLPARLLGGGSRVPSSRPLLAQFLDAGFVILAETPEIELVVGAIAQFWKPWGGEMLKIATAEEFRASRVPGYAKVAVNFLITTTLPGRVAVRTETRVQATDPHARAKFARYWRLIHPGSALIRRMWLRAIRRRVESRL